MKPLILNTFDIEGGAAIAAFRLHKGLQGIGLDSRMLVQSKSSDDPSVIGPASKWAKGFSLVRRRLDNLPLQLYRNREQTIFSPAILPDNLPSKVVALNPDLIHLHWVYGGFLRLENLRRFCKPIVWTFHDMWAFTGGCHYDDSCGRYLDSCGACPQLNSKNQSDLSHRIWKRKKKAWQDIDISIVTPSRWLSECVRTSFLFKGRDVEVIPNGLDLECYKPTDKRVAKKMMNLPLDRKVILFGALNATSDRRKGFQYLKSAVQKLAMNGWANKADLMVFGSGEPKNPPNLGLKTHYMGVLHDDISLALLYAASDVFVLPSIQDNLPNTIMEALACGTPVVAFDVGGVPEMIDHQTNGYLCKAADTDDLAHGIDWVIEDTGRSLRLGIAAREKVEKEYSLAVQAQRYADLYKKILESGLKTS